MATRVFVITDFGLLGAGISGWILGDPERLALVGIADSYAAAAQAAIAAESDVVLLDIDGSADAAIDVVRSLHAGCAAKILLITRQEDVALQDKAILLGARGVVNRAATPEMLLVAIEKVMEGQIWLDREATGRIFVQLSRGSQRQEADPLTRQLGSLTEREREIVAFIAGNGAESGKTLARRLNISESTLRNHLTAVYEKLGVSNRNGLLTYVFRHGLAQRLAG